MSEEKGSAAWDQCVALLQELQPNIWTKKKDAIDRFARYFFDAKPQLSERQVQILLRGNNNKKGLMHAVGQVSWKSFRLKKASVKAMQLLARLLNKDENPEAALYTRVFLTTDKAIFKGMKLDRHVAAKNGDSEAANSILGLIKSKRGSVADIAADPGYNPSPPGPSASSSASSIASASVAAGPMMQIGADQVPKKLKKSGFSAAWQALSNFFKRRPDADELARKGVLKRGKYFGNTLDVLQQGGLCEGGVPKIMLQCFEFLIKNSLDEPGLFRVSGDSLNIQSLKKRFDFEGDVNISECDQHDVSGLLKLFLREMPVPLMTFDLYDQFVSSMREERYDDVPKLADQLPPLHKESFDALLEFLTKVCANNEVNKMTDSNLAIVFAPNILRPKVETYQAVARDTPMAIGCLKMLIAKKAVALGNASESKSASAGDAEAKRASVSAASTTVSTTTSTTTPPATPASTTKAADNPLPPFWLEYRDPDSGRVYYYNTRTEVTQWARPVDPRATPVPPPRKRGSVSRSTAESKVSHVDPDVVESSSDEEDDQLDSVAATTGASASGAVVNGVQSNDATVAHASEVAAQAIRRSVLEHKNATAVDGAENDAIVEVGDVDAGDGRNSSTSVVLDPSQVKAHTSSPANASSTQSSDELSPMDADAAAAALEKIELGSPLPPDWSQHVDPSSGRTYYFNVRTQESTWTRPKSAAFSFRNQVECHSMWYKHTAGGCHPNWYTWRKNPQFKLTAHPSDPAKGGKVKVFATLYRTSDIDQPAESCPAIGFYIFRNDGPTVDKIHVQDADHVLRSEFVTSTSVKCEVDLEANTSYVLIPCTFNPRYQGTFTVRVHSDDDITLTPIADQERSSEVAVSGQWKGQSAGGCRNHDTWAKNPQYLLSFPGNSSSSKCPLVVVLSQTDIKNLHPIGFYVISKEGDILGKGSFMVAPEVHCRVDVDPTDSPFLIVPCTFKPGVEMPFHASVFTPAGTSPTLIKADYDS